MELTCKECGRQLEWKIYEPKSSVKSKWVAYDKILKKKHTQACHNGVPKFKTYDFVIAFWLRGVAHYKITSMNVDKLEYVFHASEANAFKEVDFITAEKFCKKMDNLYALLYL